MTERKNIYLGVLLAPYRLDYYNYLHGVVVGCLDYMEEQTKVFLKRFFAKVTVTGYAFGSSLIKPYLK